jgi:dsRNA-specific ribonuclease
LDFNRVSIQDEDGWFSSVFACGPGFQVAQIFVEQVFDKHINWANLLKNNENYKRPLQELLQSEFKVTPIPMEIAYSTEKGYHMGIYLCIGCPTHSIQVSGGSTMTYRQFNTFHEIHKYLAIHHKIVVFLGEGYHKIKQTAEQFACKQAIEHLKTGLVDFTEVVDKIQQKYSVFC